MRGYPGGASASAARASASGFQAALGSYIAWQNGARAAMLMARFIPYVGTAALVAYGLQLIRNSQVGVMGTGWTGCGPGPVTHYTAFSGLGCAMLPTGFGWTMNTPPTTQNDVWGWNITDTTTIPPFIGGYNTEYWSRAANPGAADWPAIGPSSPPLWIVPSFPPVPITYPERLIENARQAGWAIPLTVPQKLNNAPGYLAFPLAWAPPNRPLSWPAVNFNPAFMPRPAIGVAAIPIAPTRPVTRPIAITPVVPVAPARPTAPGVIAQAPARVVPVPVSVPRYPAVPSYPVKELKTRALPIFNQLIRPFNNASEAGDFVKAMHDALPPCRKTKSPKALRQAAAVRRDGKWNKKYRKADISSAEKLKDVVSFLTDLRNNPTMRRDQMCGGTREADRLQSFGARGGYKNPLGQQNSALEEYTLRALGHLANEQAKDILWGKLGRDLGKISRELGLPFGVQTLRRVSQFKLDIPQ